MVITSSHKPDDVRYSEWCTVSMQAGNPLLQPQNWTRNETRHGCSKTKMWNSQQLSDGPAARSSQQLLVSFLCRIVDVQRSDWRYPMRYVSWAYITGNRRRRIEESRSTTSVIISHRIGETHPKIGDRQTIWNLSLQRFPVPFVPSQPWGPNFRGHPFGVWVSSRGDFLEYARFIYSE